MGRRALTWSFQGPFFRWYANARELRKLKKHNTPHSIAITFAPEGHPDSIQGMVVAHDVQDRVTNIAGWVVPLCRNRVATFKST